MATVGVVRFITTTALAAVSLSVGLAAVTSGHAFADGASLHPGVGGHLGIALPLVTFARDETNTIADQLTLAFPIGIGFKLSEKAAIDFETVVSNPISPRGTTELTVDPGIVYDAGAVVVGLRLAWKIQADTNLGLIPLVHRGIADVGGGASWFVEAAFPTFVGVGPDPANTGADRTTFEFNVVVHTGISF